MIELKLQVLNLPGGTPDSISADIEGPAPFPVNANTDMVYLVVACISVMV